MAFNEAVKELKERAYDYEDYKMKDHTADPKGEAGKQKLNGDDLRILKLIHSVTRKNKYFDNVKVERDMQPVNKVVKTKPVVMKH